MCDCCQEASDLSANLLRSTPDQVAPYLSYIYKKEELDLLFLLSGGSLSLAEIEAKSGRDCTLLLASAYKRAVVDQEFDDQGNLVAYTAQTAARRINNMATFCREDWEGLPDEIRRTLSRWHFRQFVEMKRPLGYPKVAAKQNQVLPLEKVIAYMREKTDRVWVIPCDCKSTWETCGEEKRQFCMEFHAEPNTPVGRGLAREITLDEAEALLYKADELGLYHTAEAHGICNCCRCCCYPGRTTLELGYKGLWPKIAYQAVRNEALCQRCHRCVERCPKEALSLEGETVQFKAENCWGCGLCQTTCPAGAIEMVKISNAN